MVCNAHISFVDLSLPKLGKRNFEALYKMASSMLCFDLAENDRVRECGLCSEEIGVDMEFTECAQGHVVCKECT